MPLDTTRRGFKFKNGGGCRNFCENLCRAQNGCGYCRKDTSLQFNGTSSAENAFEVKPEVALPLYYKPPASKGTMRNI